MTALEAAELARQTLRRGYFRPPGAEPYVRCPECRVNVRRYVSASAKAAQIAQGLREALTAHLLDDCAQVTR